MSFDYVINCLIHKKLLTMWLGIDDKITSHLQADVMIKKVICAIQHIN